MSIYNSSDPLNINTALVYNLHPVHIADPYKAALMGCIEWMLTQN